jgi:hypothetical protein
MRWRTAGRVAATVPVGLVVPVAPAAASGHDSGRPTAVLVLGSEGANAADGPSLPEQVTPVYLHDRPGFAFDAALRDIARTRDVATARWVATSLQYPTATPWLSGPAWPWDLTRRPVLIAAAVAAAVGIQLTIRRASTGGDHATAHPS